MCLIGKKITWLFVFLMLRVWAKAIIMSHCQPFKIFTSPYTILNIYFSTNFTDPGCTKISQCPGEAEVLIIKALYFYKFFIR